MTKFKYIELFLDETYDISQQRQIVFSSRCICNYIERLICPLQIEAPYSRLNINCSKDFNAVHTDLLSSERILEVYIKFDLPNIDSLSLQILQQQFIKIILSGLSAANVFHPIPINIFTQTLQQFEDGGYVNCWVCHDKYWIKHECRCTIHAELTVDRFILNQFIYINNRLIASCCITETKPREGIFINYLSGVLSIYKNSVIQYKKGSKILSTFDLQSKQFVSTL